MLFPIIKVSDNGHEHIIGTNTHDLLYIGKDGGIHYLNQQCMCGTEEDEEDGMDIHFVGKQDRNDPYDVYPRIEMVTFEKLAEIAKQNAEEYTENKLKFDAILREYLAEITKHEETLRKDAEVNGKVITTVGNLM